MMNNIQHMRKKNQQKLGKDRSPAYHSPGEEEEDFRETIAVRDQGNFLDRFSPLFRKSSLLLVLMLGRDYTSKFHVRDLSRSLKYDVSLISKNLKNLETFGLVTHEEVGNLVFYQANMESVLLKQIKICFTLMELNQAISALGHLSTNTILYGSCAKGEDTSTSDIDLFIETMEKEEVGRILHDFQTLLQRTLSPVIRTPDETYRMKMQDKNFYASIQQGIVIKEGGFVF